MEIWTVPETTSSSSQRYSASPSSLRWKNIRFQYQIRWLTTNLLNICALTHFPPIRCCPGSEMKTGLLHCMFFNIPGSPVIKPHCFTSHLLFRATWNPTPSALADHLSQPCLPRVHFLCHQLRHDPTQTWSKPFFNPYPRIQYIRVQTYCTHNILEYLSSAA